MRAPDRDPPYQLDFTPRFEQEVEMLLGLPRGAEVMEGLETVLKRNPRAVGQQVPETDVYVIQVIAPGSDQEYSVFYRVEGRGSVTLLSLYPVSPEDLG